VLIKVFCVLLVQENNFKFAVNFFMSNLVAENNIIIMNQNLQLWVHRAILAAPLILWSADFQSPFSFYLTV